MVRVSARCRLLGLLWWTLCLFGADSLIEIVEEQRCHDYEFRLTCRDLDTHIAVLEAWYTSIDEYHTLANTTRPPENLQLKTENDSELDRVYIYSSPKHNGVYAPTNHSDNFTNSVNTTIDDARFLNDSLRFLNDSLFLNDTVEMSVEFLNASEECGVPTFARSYASWHEGDKRRRHVERSSSINLRAPLSYSSSDDNAPPMKLSEMDPSGSCHTLHNQEFSNNIDIDQLLDQIDPIIDDNINKEALDNVLIELREHIERDLSKRCTGVNHCSFILAKDYPPSVSWLPGVIYIKYACFDDSVSLHYCNREVRIAESGPDSEGYIRTPGYPHFYVGDECRWQLRVNPEQKIRVTLLDVSLRSIGPFEDHCADYISVQDSDGETLLSSCDQVELPLQLTSITDTVEVLVEARSKGAFPKRGVLLHYKSVGCVTLPAPSDGYLVYRNGDVAHYMCNVNFVFIDTRQRARLIWCYDDNRWNDTVPFCVEETSPTVVGKDSGPASEEKDTKLPSEANMIVDIVIPSLLIAALFIGNAFIVLIIYKYRKRKNDDLEDEFNTIPLSYNGNIHSAGNAV